MRGVHQNKKVEIRHTYDKGKKGRQLYLTISVEIERDFYEEAAKIAVDKDLTSESFRKVMDEAITASSDPEFGEIYWDVKRRRGKR